MTRAMTQASISASAPAPAAAPRHLPGFSAPAVGFEQPFAMLEACHERVQRTLGLLGRLREHVRKQGVDHDARQAARDVLRYFDIAAPLHHQDEELHIFPALLAEATPQTKALVEQLQQDHVAMTADWAAARLPLVALADGQAKSLSERDCAVLDRFAGRYVDHIRSEESQAYPLAHSLFPPAELESVGREMARRRGAD